MAPMFDNLTAPDLNPNCTTDAPYIFSIMTTDVLTVLIGQPVMMRLLWIAFRAKKKDFLNINLAFFHSLQYLLSTVHFFVALNQKESALHIVKFLSVYVLIGGPVSLSFICLERYVAVIHPASYPLLKTRRCREACVLSTWVLMLPAAIVKGITHPDWKILMGALDSLAFSVILFTICVIAWCNVAILKALRKSGPATDKLHPAKKRALRTVRAISIIVLLCYIPVTVTNLYRFLTFTFYCVDVAVTIFFLSLASVAHPVFYLATTDPLFPCHWPTATT